MKTLAQQQAECADHLINEIIVEEHKITPNYLRKGKPILCDAAIHSVDHFETTYVLKVRSLSPVYVSDITKKLQEKWEVTDCKITRQDVNCK